MAEDQETAFGDLLRRHRLVAGLSQQALAERAGISVDAVAALERGRRRRPRAFTVRVLADTLGLGQAQLEQLVEAAKDTLRGRRGKASRAPAPVTPLVGRDAERDTVAGLLRQDGIRLVTLTGPGGVGKTQLALAVARRVADDFPDGIGWAPLALLDGPDALTQAVASAFGVRETPGRPLLDSLTEHVAARDLLLVLDNCEHLVSACAALVDRLLAGAPGLHVLATSRERLRLGTEVVRPVAPLPVPLGHRRDDLEHSPAAHLFIQRARQLVPYFEIAPGDEQTLARVCSELDGLPLALELAAARTNVLTVRQIADGIDEAASTAVDAPARHRTLRATIDWSYRLLTAEEQQALDQLAVFAGGWTLAAAATTCPVVRDSQHALALTSSLVDKSLAIAVPGTEGVRYHLLFTVRRFALGRLRASGEADAVAAAHARYVTDLAERAEPRLHGGEQLTWLNRLDAEINNVRTALTWANANDGELGVRLAGALWRYCYLRGRYSEGRSWLGATLAGDHHVAPALLAKALLGAGALAFLQCDYDLAAARVEEALRLYRETRSRRGVAEALQRLGSICRERGEYERARRFHEESLSLWRAAAEQPRVAESLNYLGFLAWLTGGAEAFATSEEALTMFRRLGDGEGTAWALINLGAAASYRGKLDLANRLLRESLELCYGIGFSEGIAWSLDQLGRLARRRGETGVACELLAESLKGHLDLGDRWRAASVCEELAAALVDARPKLAATLLGSAERLRGSDARRPPVEDPGYTDTVASCVAALGRASFAEQVATGQIRPCAELLDEVGATHAAEA